MSIELTHRRIFAILQTLVGLFVPAIYASSLTTFSLATGFYKTAYWLGLPATSFLILAWVSLSRREDQFRVSLSGIWGAAIAGYLTFTIPPIFLYFTTGAYYRGGGANIGVALLIVAMPVYLPFAMTAGFAFGNHFNNRRKHT